MVRYYSRLYCGTASAADPAGADHGAEGRQQTLLALQGDGERDYTGPEAGHEYVRFLIVVIRNYPTRSNLDKFLRNRLH